MVKADLDHWTLIYNGDYLALDKHLDGPNWEGDSTWRESFLTGSLDLYGHEGKVYGVPLLYSVNVAWYDKNMFAEHGWKPARTWNEFLALCEQIKATGMWPLAFQGRYPSYASSMVDNTFYHLAGRERFFGQKRLHAGSFDNPEAIRALA